MKDSPYMKHDVNAHQDESVMWMLSEYGPNGYGLYWLTNEYLRNQSGCVANVKRISVIAFSLRVDTEELERFINDCIEKYGLYVTDGEFFWSKRMVEDKEHLDSVRETYRENGKKGGRPKKDDKPKNDVPAPYKPEKNQAVNQSETNGFENQNQTKTNKGNKGNKGKVSVGKKTARFSKPTRTEFEKYCKEINYPGNYDRFYNYYEQKDWMIGKNRMKNWKAAVQTWKSRDQEQSRASPVPEYKPSPVLQSCDECGCTEINTTLDAGKCPECGAFYELQGGKWVLAEHGNIVKFLNKSVEL